MGKIVKFCDFCDESFAEKFSFCPNCGAALQAFEMNPVASAEPNPGPAREVGLGQSGLTVTEPAAAMANERNDVGPAAAFDEHTGSEKATEEEAMVAAFAAAENGSNEASASLELPDLASGEKFVPLDGSDNVDDSHSDELPDLVDSPINYPTYSDGFGDRSKAVYAADTEFHVTVIEDKNTGQRNTLMMGAFILVTFSVLSGLVYNIFSKDLEVASINDDIFNAVLVDDVPMAVEEEKEKLRDKKDAGGGGGGGKEEKEETTRGDLADQSPKPIRPPDAKVFRSDNFELKMPPPQTEGNRTFEKKFDRWGDPNGRFESFSNGTGSGGGQGSGIGTGQGSGRGTGVGSGDGSGSGSGLGSGNGSGRGGGRSGDDDDGPPPRPTGVTQPLKILSKPRPGYTDAARQNNVQGTVILRVTFLPSGQIGSITAIKGLPYGLTEQAIAAARQMKFEPAKRDGIAQAVTRQVEYTFSIY
jgi:protein TonB